MSDLDLLAANFVLGTLDSEARADVAGRLAREPELAAALEKWERRLTALDSDAPPVDVSPGLWDRIRSALDAPPAPTVGFLTVRASEGEWVNRAPGIDRKTLFIDHEAGIGSYLYRMAPGAVIPEHTHRRLEECVMLEGETMFAGTRLQAGDFHVAFPGSTHPAITSRSGALFYLRVAIS